MLEIMHAVMVAAGDLLGIRSAQEAALRPGGRARHDGIAGREQHFGDIARRHRHLVVLVRRDGGEFNGVAHRCRRRRGWRRGRDDGVVVIRAGRQVSGQAQRGDQAEALQDRTTGRIGGDQFFQRLAGNDHFAIGLAIWRARLVCQMRHGVAPR